MPYLKGVALVQSASRGIGLQIARQLLERTELHVVATARDVGRLEQALAAINVNRNNNTTIHHDPRTRLTLLPLDVCDERSIESVATNIRNRHGEESLRLAINASGVLIEPEKNLRALDSSVLLDKVLRVNAVGPALVAKHMVPLMRRESDQSSPAILASLSAKTGSIADNKLGGWYSYRMSKAALNMFTKTLSCELASRKRLGMIAVALHPGTVDTDLSRPHIKGVAASQIQSAEASAKKLVDLLLNLKESDNGKFLSYDGSEIAW